MSRPSPLDHTVSHLWFLLSYSSRQWPLEETDWIPRSACAPLFQLVLISRLTIFYTDFLLFPNTLLINLAIDFDPLGRLFSFTLKFEVIFLRTVVNIAITSWQCSAADSSQNWHLLSIASFCPSSQPTSLMWHKSCLLPTKNNDDSTILK